MSKIAGLCLKISNTHSLNFVIIIESMVKFHEEGFILPDICPVMPTFQAIIKESRMSNAIKICFKGKYPLQT